jgi:4-amino-4-deoxychorismate lyase
MNAQSVVLVDGVASPFIPANDRGLMYGDGVFRTLHVVDSTPRWWDEHLAKLAEDCARLGLPAPEPETWRADLEQVNARMKSGVLKLIVTRGSGPRGYAPAEDPQIRRLMQYDATPDATPRTASSASGGDITLRVCSLRLGWQPRLAGIKHLNRLENVLARAEWNSPEIHEGLLLDQSERVISGVMSNLFIWTQNRLLTPQLDQCGVAGVARGRLMRLARAQGIVVAEARLGLQDVLNASEVMFTNSVWGLRRVAHLETKSWPDAVISPHLSEILDA